MIVVIQLLVVLTFPQCWKAQCKQNEVHKNVHFCIIRNRFKPWHHILRIIFCKSHNNFRHQEVPFCLPINENTSKQNLLSMTMNSMRRRNSICYIYTVEYFLLLPIMSHSPYWHTVYGNTNFKLAKMYAKTVNGNRAALQWNRFLFLKQSLLDTEEFRQLRLQCAQRDSSNRVFFWERALSGKMRQCARQTKRAHSHVKHKPHKPTWCDGMCSHIHYHQKSPLSSSNRDMCRKGK